MPSSKEILRRPLTCSATLTTPSGTRSDSLIGLRFGRLRCSQWKMSGPMSRRRENIMVTEY